MSSVNSLTGPFQAQLLHFNGRRWHLLRPAILCSISRHSSRHRSSHSKSKPQHKSSSSDDWNLRVVIDTEQLPHQVSSSMQKLFRAPQAKFRQFVFSGQEAFEDLKTLIAVDFDRRVVISCRRSTLQFFGSLILWSCVIVLALRVLGGLGLGLRRRFGFGFGTLVRRDRSLAGREVVVGKKKTDFRVLGNPLSPAPGNVPGIVKAVPNKRVRTVKLPGWWPVSRPPPIANVNNEDNRREANRLIRAIMESRMSGNDILEDDIIQLRSICRTSGVRVSFDTTNTRDSFYRAAVEFVLNICSRATIYSAFVQINGEDAQQFVAGLADDIRVEPIRAARIVSAAVAACTRSSFLQAWAFVLQGKYSEAVAELSKICCIHRTFPPEESSPEMEMVALGLAKHLKVGQREHLMNMLVRLCDDCHRSAAEALGLTNKYEGAGSQWES